MRTILLWALLMLNYNLFAADLESGLCTPFPDWGSWAVVPLLFSAAVADLWALLMRYHRLREWHFQRQRYLRMRAWVSRHSDVTGVV